MSRQIERLVWFSAGILINSFGIVLITKGALGTSQISSIPYVLSLQMPSISFGMFSFIMNMCISSCRPCCSGDSSSRFSCCRSW